jgi:hypothetical protein
VWFRLVQYSEHFRFRDCQRLLLVFCIILLSSLKRAEFGKSRAFRGPVCASGDCLFHVVTALPSLEATYSYVLPLLWVVDTLPLEMDGRMSLRAKTRCELIAFRIMKPVLDALACQWLQATDLQGAQQVPSGVQMKLWRHKALRILQVKLQRNSVTEKPRG